jgi:hypothetical protein
MGCPSPGDGSDAAVDSGTLEAGLDAGTDAGADAGVDSGTTVCSPAAVTEDCVASATWCEPSFEQARVVASGLCGAPGQTSTRTVGVASCAPGRSAVTYLELDPRFSLLLNDWACVYASDGGLVGGVRRSDHSVTLAGAWEPECAVQTCSCDAGCP